MKNNRNGEQLVRKFRTARCQRAAFEHRFHVKEKMTIAPGGIGNIQWINLTGLRDGLSRNGQGKSGTAAPIRGELLTNEEKSTYPESRQVIWGKCEKGDQQGKKGGWKP